MRLSCVLLVAVATLVASGNALSSTDQTAILKVESDNGKRLLRSVETVDEDDSSDDQDEDDSSDDLDEERAGWNIFGAKTAEEIRQATVRASNDEFYKQLLNSASFRENRFAGWKSDGVSIDAALRFLEIHGRTQQKYKDVIEKYRAFLQN